MVKGDHNNREKQKICVYLREKEKRRNDEKGRLLITNKLYVVRKKKSSNLSNLRTMHNLRETWGM